MRRPSALDDTGGRRLSVPETVWNLQPRARRFGCRKHRAGGGAMTATNPALPVALQRALPLFASPPADVEASRGYLDLLGGQTDQSTSPIQSLWASDIGARLYDPVQALTRRFFTPTRLPASALRLPSGAHVLDVGCGPGNITAQLGRAIGSSGLALGLDVS